MEAFILYIWICYGANCQWVGSGSYERSIALSEEIINGYRSKAPKYSGQQMCERAAAELQLKPTHWKCINSGLHK